MPPFKTPFAISALLCCSLLSLGGCGGSSGPPAAPGTRYVIADLNPTDGPALAAQSSQATALNDAGQVTIMTSQLQTNVFVPQQDQSFLYDGSKYVPLPLAEPVALNNKGQAISYDGIAQNGVVSAFPFVMASDTFSETFPSGINDQGQIVGASSASVLQLFGPSVQKAAVTYAFLYQNGRVTRLVLSVQDTVGGTQSYPSSAAAINNKSQIVGSFYTGVASSDAMGINHAFFYDNSNATDLGTLGGDSSAATALNNNGQVVGYSEVPGSVLPVAHSVSAILRSQRGIGKTLRSAPTPPGYHAALWQNGAAIDLSTPNNGTANAINDQGQIVGDFSTGTSDSRAFVYRGGKFQDLNTLLINGGGWTLRRATGINAKGQICGEGIYKGAYHAFLLTPQ